FQSMTQGLRIPTIYRFPSDSSRTLQGFQTEKSYSAVTNGHRNGHQEAHPTSCRLSVSSFARCRHSLPRISEPACTKVHSNERRWTTATAPARPALIRQAAVERDRPVLVVLGEEFWTPPRLHDLHCQLAGTRMTLLRQNVDDEVAANLV